MYPTRIKWLLINEIVKGKCDENNRIYKIGFITIAVFCFFLSIAIGIMAAYITSKPKTEEINSSIPDTANVVESIEESVEDKDKISQDEGIKSLEDIAELKSAVVKIETETTQGSGVLISEEGHILTNWHIIEGSRSPLSFTLMAKTTRFTMNTSMLK